jgi:hypothetical protein
MAVFSRNRDFAGCRTMDSNPGCTASTFHRHGRASLVEDGRERPFVPAIHPKRKTWMLGMTVSISCRFTARISARRTTPNEEITRAKLSIEQILLVSRNQREGSCFDAEISCEREKKHTLLNVLLRRSIVAVQ